MKVESIRRDPEIAQPGSTLPSARAPRATLIIEELVQRPVGISGESWQRARAWSTED
jgi:hypothetical protein